MVQHPAHKIHFTVPERFCLPGLTAARRQDMLRSWLCNRRLTHLTVALVACNRPIWYSVRNRKRKTNTEEISYDIGREDHDLAQARRLVAGGAGGAGRFAPVGVEGEGAQSVPDMQKVVQMSRLFGVTTDYLLKEELGEPEPAQSEPDAPLRCVTMEQAADYLSLRRAAAPKLRGGDAAVCALTGGAAFACRAQRPAGRGPLENAAVGIGLCVLLVLVAAAVAVFITCAAQVKAYAFSGDRAV